MDSSEEMKVTKRNNMQEDISFDKILKRVKTLSNMYPQLSIIYSKLVMKVIDQLFNGICTTQIDELTAEQCASMSPIHSDYGILASRIVISNHHKNTRGSFMYTMKDLYEFRDVHGMRSSLIAQDFWHTVETYGEELEEMIDYSRDYLIDYFGFKTLERAYLIQINKKIVERPQHMWMRVAVALHGKNMVEVKETYDYMSQKYFTHATPTLFNAGTPRSQLSSCYLIGMEDDSIDGIYDTLKDCGRISKWAGGIGLHIHNVRGSGSHIRGTNGISNGIVPMLRVFNATARYIDQGGGKRNGSFAIYLEPWHKDIVEFLDLKKNHGDEEQRARDLFYALWIPDLFMEKVKNNEQWALFCPDECPGLADVYGEEFVTLYNKYVSENRASKTVNARDLWYRICDSQMETGTPYILYKDSANKKSNQKNLGTIKSSNLCTEIIEYSDSNETAVCNLASIGLSMFVTDQVFDYNKLHAITKIVTNNLNKIIDINFYPTEKTRRSNLLHRPIGIGVQGLADVFMLMDIPFYSDEAKEINKQIFETIYHAALEKSMELSKERKGPLEDIGSAVIHGRGLLNSGQVLREALCDYYTDQDMVCNTYKSTGDHFLDDLFNRLKPTVSELMRVFSDVPVGSYSTFEGSPASQGILQFDMWGVKPSNRFDWNGLKKDIMQYGLRNSLLLAPMPTASTSQILGNNECFEPFTSNIYTRRTLAGDFVLVNKHLQRELIEMGLWSDDLKTNIIANKGSVQYIEGLSDHMKEKYRIVWEIPMKHIIDMAKDRGAFICQSQSMNLWVEDPNYKILTAMHFYSWNAGLKTGLYYLRRKPKHQPQQFTIEPTNEGTNEEEPCDMCSG